MIVIILFVLMTNLAATFFVIRNKNMSARAKFFSLGGIWLLPIVGSIMAMEDSLFRRTRKSRLQPPQYEDDRVPLRGEAGWAVRGLDQAPTVLDNLRSLKKLWKKK